MIRNLVWLFPAHREAQQRIAFLEQALETAIKQIQEGPVDMSRMLETYNERVLQEAPYADGRIPDDAWLTPGDNR